MPKCAEGNVGWRDGGEHHRREWGVVLRRRDGRGDVLKRLDAAVVRGVAAGAVLRDGVDVVGPCAASK